MALRQVAEALTTDLNTQKPIAIIRVDEPSMIFALAKIWATPYSLTNNKEPFIPDYCRKAAQNEQHLRSLLPTSLGNGETASLPGVAAIIPSAILAKEIYDYFENKLEPEQLFKPKTAPTLEHYLRISGPLTHTTRAPHPTYPPNSDYAVLSDRFTDKVRNDLDTNQGLVAAKVLIDLARTLPPEAFQGESAPAEVEKAYNVIKETIKRADESPPIIANPLSTSGDIHSALNILKKQSPAGSAQIGNFISVLKGAAASGSTFTNYFENERASNHRPYFNDVGKSYFKFTGHLPEMGGLQYARANDEFFNTAYHFVIDNPSHVITPMIVRKIAAASGIDIYAELIDHSDHTFGPKPLKDRSIANDEYDVIKQEADSLGKKFNSTGDLLDAYKHDTDKILDEVKRTLARVDTAVQNNSQATQLAKELSKEEKIAEREKEAKTLEGYADILKSFRSIKILPKAVKDTAAIIESGARLVSGFKLISTGTRDNLIKGAELTSIAINLLTDVIGLGGPDPVLEKLDQISTQIDELHKALIAEIDGVHTHLDQVKDNIKTMLNTHHNSVMHELRAIREVTSNIDRRAKTEGQTRLDKELQDRSHPISTILDEVFHNLRTCEPKANNKSDPTRTSDEQCLMAYALCLTSTAKYSAPLGEPTGIASKDNLTNGVSRIGQRIRKYRSEPHEFMTSIPEQITQSYSGFVREELVISKGNPLTASKKQSLWKKAESNVLYSNFMNGLGKGDIFALEAEHGNNYELSQYSSLSDKEGQGGHIEIVKRCTDGLNTYLHSLMETHKNSDGTKDTKAIDDLLRQMNSRVSKNGKIEAFNQHTWEQMIEIIHNTQYFEVGLRRTKSGQANHLPKLDLLTAYAHQLQKVAATIAKDFQTIQIGSEVPQKLYDAFNGSAANAIDKIMANLKPDSYKVKPCNSPAGPKGMSVYASAESGRSTSPLIPLQDDDMRGLLFQMSGEARSLLLMSLAKHQESSGTLALCYDAGITNLRRLELGELFHADVAKSLVDGGCSNINYYEGSMGVRLRAFTMDPDNSDSTPELVSAEYTMGNTVRILLDAKGNAVDIGNAIRNPNNRWTTEEGYNEVASAFETHFFSPNCSTPMSTDMKNALMRDTKFLAPTKLDGMMVNHIGSGQPYVRNEGDHGLHYQLVNLNLKAQDQNVVKNAKAYFNGVWQKLITKHNQATNDKIDGQRHDLTSPLTVLDNHRATLLDFIDKSSCDSEEAHKEFIRVLIGTLPDTQGIQEANSHPFDPKEEKAKDEIFWKWIDNNPTLKERRYDLQDRAHWVLPSSVRWEFLATDGVDRTADINLQTNRKLTAIARELVRLTEVCKDNVPYEQELGVALEELSTTFAKFFGFEKIDPISPRASITPSDLDHKNIIASFLHAALSRPDSISPFTDNLERDALLAKKELSGERKITRDAMTASQNGQREADIKTNPSVRGGEILARANADALIRNINIHLRPALRDAADLLFKNPDTRDGISLLTTPYPKQHEAWLLTGKKSIPGSDEHLIDTFAALPALDDGSSRDWFTDQSRKPYTGKNGGILEGYYSKEPIAIEIEAPGNGIDAKIIKGADTPATRELAHALTMLSQSTGKPIRLKISANYIALNASDTTPIFANPGDGESQRLAFGLFQDGAIDLLAPELKSTLFSKGMVQSKSENAHEIILSQSIASPARSMASPIKGPLDPAMVQDSLALRSDEAAAYVSEFRNYGINCTTPPKPDHTPGQIRACQLMKEISDLKKRFDGNHLKAISDTKASSLEKLSAFTEAQRDIVNMRRKADEARGLILVYEDSKPQNEKWLDTDKRLYSHDAKTRLVGSIGDNMSAIVKDESKLHQTNTPATPKILTFKASPNGSSSFSGSLSARKQHIANALARYSQVAGKPITLNFDITSQAPEGFLAQKGSVSRNQADSDLLTELDLLSTFVETDPTQPAIIHTAVGRQGSVNSTARVLPIVDSTETNTLEAKNITAARALIFDNNYLDNELRALVDTTVNRFNQNHTALSTSANSPDTKALLESDLKRDYLVAQGLTDIALLTPIIVLGQDYDNSVGSNLKYRRLTSDAYVRLSKLRPELTRIKLLLESMRPAAHQYSQRILSASNPLSVHQAIEFRQYAAAVLAEARKTVREIKSIETQAELISNDKHDPKTNIISQIEQDTGRTAAARAAAIAQVIKPPTRDLVVKSNPNALR